MPVHPKHSDQDGVGQMNRIGKQSRYAYIPMLAIVLAAVAGCGDGPPPVDLSDRPGELQFAPLPKDPGPAPIVDDELSTVERGSKGLARSTNGVATFSEASVTSTPPGEVSAPTSDAEATTLLKVAADQTPEAADSPPSRQIEAQVSDAAQEVVATVHNQADSSHGDAVAVSHDASGEAKPKFEEPLFEGWPRPEAAIMITGRQYGYLEPCGCAGLANQKGGMVRRYVLLNQLREKNWPVAALDAGNQIRRFGRQAEIKFQITIEGLRMMGYGAIGFGPDDLRLPAPELIAVIAPTDEGPSEFVSANAVVLDQSFTSPMRVLQVGDKKIGITSVLGARNAKMINNDDIMLTSAEEGLDKVWPALKSQNCDLYVLIAHATIDESIALGKKYPQFPVVITTGGAGEPTRQPENIAGTRSQLVQVGTKGMYAGVLGLFEDPSQPLRYQRVPLDGRFPDSPEMLRLLAAYQDQLKQAGWEGLGIRAQPHPSGRTFVGSDTCADCHPGDYDIWKDGHDGKGGPHWHATETLVNPGERTEVPRNFDPECISCHVVGWNPQKYYPYESGYLSLTETPDKHDVGCENCHGPGSAHVAAELGDIDATDEELEKYQLEMRLPLERAEQKCLECHDLDNSPAFQEPGAFERYWEKIKH
jgi:hypothetical protein